MSQVTKQVHTRLQNAKQLEQVIYKFNISKIRMSFPYRTSHMSHVFNNQMS